MGWQKVDYFANTIQYNVTINSIIIIRQLGHISASILYSYRVSAKQNYGKRRRACSNSIALAVKRYNLAGR